MAGLLDFYADPQANMALAAGLLSGGNFGQALGRGMAGAQAVQLAEQERRLRESQARENEMRAQSYRDKVEAEKASAQRDAMFQEALQKGVSPAQLAQFFPEKVDLLKKLADAPNFGRQAVVRTIDGTDEQGRPVTYQVDQFGERIGGGIGQWKAPIQVNQGDRQTFVNPVDMKPLGAFGINMSPSERDASARGWASNAATIRGQDMADARARETADLQGRNLALQLQERETKMAEAARAKEGRADAIDVSMRSLNNLIKHPGFSAGVGATWQPRIPMYGEIPGTDKAGFMTQLDAFKSQTFLPMVEQLRGTGALSDAEGKKLTQAVGALDPAMPESEFKRQAGLIMSDLQAARERVGVPRAARFGESDAPVLSSLPTANASNKGKRIRDTATGKILVSNGLQWKEE